MPQRHSRSAVSDPAAIREQIRAAHRWLNEHRQDLQVRYPDRYVAIHANAVVASSDELGKLRTELAAKHLADRALVAFIELPGAQMGI